MNLIKSHKIISAGIVVSVIAVTGFTVASASKEIVNENGLNTYEQCMVEANDLFMQYLEDNSTTYKFDDGDVINLPHYDGVIEEAKQILKAREQEC